MIVKASQYPTYDSNDYNRDDINRMVPNSDIAHIKHDQPSWPKKATFPRVADFNEGPEHHHHNSCAEESSP